MWRPVVVTAAPAAEPIATADAKLHVRVDGNDENGLIDSYVAAARSHVEGVTGTRMVTQTVSLKTDDWNDLADMPVAPIQSITTIAYVDTAGDVITLSTDVYETRLDLLEPSVALKHGKAWPARYPGSLITVTAVVGYGAAGAQPPAVLQAIRLVLADFYAQRETVSDGPMVSAPVAASVDALLSNHRKHLI